MGVLRNRLLRRFGPLGRALDLAMVAGAGVRFARSRGWVSDAQLNSWGLGSMSALNPPANAGAPGSAGMGELLLIGGALWRLFRGRKRRRRA